MNLKTALSPFALAALLVALAFSSCSKVNDMHDATMEMNATTARMAALTEQMNRKMESMNASTDEMNRKTKELNEHTDHMKAATDEMQRVMVELYDSGRQAAAADLRNKQWELMAAAKTLEDKAIYGGLYLLSYEYQVWSNLGRDAAPKERERLMQDAVDEFFRHLLGITHWAPEDVDPLAGKNPIKNKLNPEVENEKASFNAIAGALERTNRKQELTPESAKDELSMLSMIETALKAGQDIKAGKAKLSDFPAYVDIVLSRQELATRLLVARYQVMGLATLGYLTTMTRSVEEGASFVLLGRSWDLDFNQLNESQLRVVSFRLGEAIKARNFLAGLGVRVELDSSIARVFSHGRVLNAPGSQGAHTAGGSDLASAQNDVLDKLKDYTAR